MAPKSRRKPDKRKRVRALARERVGTVKPSRVIEPDKSHKKPKHKKPIATEEEDL